MAKFIPTKIGLVNLDHVVFIGVRTDGDQVVHLANGEITSTSAGAVANIALQIRFVQVQGYKYLTCDESPWNNAHEETPVIGLYIEEQTISDNVIHSVLLDTGHVVSVGHGDSLLAMPDGRVTNGDRVFRSRDAWLESLGKPNPVHNGLSAAELLVRELNKSKKPQ